MDRIYKLGRQLQPSWLADAASATKHAVPDAPSPPPPPPSPSPPLPDHLPQMAQRRVPVMSWVQPESDGRFAVGSDVGLRLYRMEAARDSSADVVFDMADFRSMRYPVTCLASYPRALERLSVMAVGTQSGELSLQFYPMQGSDGLGGEYSSSSSICLYEASGRVCRQIAFNPANTNLMACGFDSKDNRPSLTINDTARNMDVGPLLGSRSTPWSVHSNLTDAILGPQPQQQQPQSHRQSGHSRTPSASSSSAAASRDGEYGPVSGGSCVTSLSWVPGSASALFFASKRTRWSIRWFDMREPSKNGTVLYVPMLGAGNAGLGSPGTVYDLQFDPFNSVRYMAHDRCGTVNMWDIRWATKPTYTFNTGQRAVLSMQFSPRRSGTVALLAADSDTFDIYTLGEFFNGRAAQSEQLNPSAILDSAWTKDQYSDDRVASMSAPPPPGLHLWTDHAATVPLPPGLSEPHTAFLWVPPSVSGKTRCSKQLISSGKSSALYATALPVPRIGVTNCHGHLAISNNWSKLQGALPATNLQMDLLHIAVPEMCEIVLDKNRLSHSMRATAGAAASAQISMSASLSSMQHMAQQPSVSGSGIIARRHQAAHSTSADGDPKVAHLRDRLRAMNPGAGEGPASVSVAEAGVKWLSSQLGEQLLAGSISYNPSADEPRADDDSIRAELSSDILVQMRMRALQGYGTNADINAHTFRDDTKARDMWLWIRDAHIRRHNGAYYTSYGADASFFGVYDIMHLRRKELKYLYEQSQLEAQRSMQLAAIPRTRLDGQRRLALSFCGWGLEGYIREQHIRALENADKFSAAAGTSFIYGDHQRCLQSLEKSTEQDQKLLSFMLKAQLDKNSLLAPVQAGKEAPPPGDMFKCPHLQMIFMYLATGDWNRVVDDTSRLPMSYRLAIVLRYLDDSSLMRFLLRSGRLAVKRGDLDGILITGIGGSGRLIMQTYVDNTADVQTAALVSISDSSSDLVANETAEKWIYEYRHLLNMWRMFTTRCLFDIAHGNYREAKGLSRVSDIGENIAVRPADIRCTYCHKSLGYGSGARKSRHLRSGGPRSGGSAVSTPGIGAGPGSALGMAAAAVEAGSAGPGIGGGGGGGVRPLLAMSAAAASDPRRKDQQQSQMRLLYTHCPKCHHKLPRCVVCRLKLGAPVMPAESDVPAAPGSDFSQWFSWCQTCGHGGHVVHMQSWFATHSVCPVPACNCECDKRD
ncbi:hypothetical protein LPJ61_002546 [Coemansia biformis]|uniref:WD repeat protein mio zinc-ribbon like domain-containing protein n=1 Tax=Coemansia biformis TaxID=1286918 RepID=A0A9W8CX44_9FUNG|nr:hypothetical protein LPJ61_002546 [Coemansia biformis]